MPRSCFIFASTRRPSATEKSASGRLHRTRTNLRNAARGKLPPDRPPAGRRMENVAFVGKSNQHVDVEKIRHGSSASMSRTRAGVSFATPAGARRTLKPALFLIMRPLGRPSRSGSSTTERFFLSQRTEKTVPGIRPSERRTVLLRTTCPLVERVVVMFMCKTILHAPRSVNPSPHDSSQQPPSQTIRATPRAGDGLAGAGRGGCA